MHNILSLLCNCVEILEDAKQNRDEVGIRKHRRDQGENTKIELEQLVYVQHKEHTRIKS